MKDKYNSFYKDNLHIILYVLILYNQRERKDKFRKYV